MGGSAPSFLRDPRLRLLLFGGKGGVGKTTCAVAMALARALHTADESILLVSTDPAHSLADSLAGSSPPGNLTVRELDAQECLAAFKEKHGRTLREIAAHGTFLDDDDIQQFVNLSPPGMDEMMAFLEIARWVEEGHYSSIVVDTAPTGHTLRLLEMTALIRGWLGVLDALLAKHRYMKRCWSKVYRPDQMDAFLEKLARSVNKMEALLGDSARCRFVPVMLAEALSLSETVMLIAALKRRRIPVTDLVVNRLYPETRCPLCADGRVRQQRELARFSAQLSGYTVWGIPLYPYEVCGLDRLGTFWDEAEALEVTSHLSPPFEREGGGEQGWPQVEAPAELPAPGIRLLLFAGKGGVGKTTLACATAVRLARAPEGRQVFLFSTDPAHSLSACLDVPVGPQATRLSAGLTAMEIDAQAEFEAVKAQYAEELEEFLHAALPTNLDLPFDRAVMERILDLSPPGLDEIMALTRVMELLGEERYDLFILDSAPTGHLIRLLEMPELLDRWLKVFFGLFLKYKNIFRLPIISQRLVELSKELKCLRALLTDPTRSALYAVTILTEMAYEETRDLLAACARMGVAVPVLFLNLATPASTCSLCLAVHRQESGVRRKFCEGFPLQSQTLVYRQREPHGIGHLARVGELLYSGIQDHT